MLTKHDLLLALTKFPDTTALAVAIGDLTVPLAHVQLTLDAAPQIIEPKNDGDSLTSLLAGRVKLTLVGEDPTVPKLTEPQKREILGMRNALAPTEKP